MTIHLVYPHRKSNSAPDVIGYVLSQALSSVGPVVTHEWDSIRKIVPQPGDILIGHPHPFSFSIFRRSLKNNNWSRIIVLQPFNLDINQVGYIDSIIDSCDLFLAITGKYWFDQISKSSLSRWKEKMVHIDLAVDRDSFPRVKYRFNVSGQRKFLYIGNDNPVKNLAFLSKIAQVVPEYCFAWAGNGKEWPGLKRLGYVDFSTAHGRELLSEYDFMITVGTADANPTTILEAMSWGLVPVCTPTSGYENIPGIVNVPTNDLEGTVSILRRLQHATEDELLSLVSHADNLLNVHYNWDRFCGQVISAVLSDESPQLSRPPVLGRLGYWRLNGSVRMFARLALNNLKYWIKYYE